MKSEVEAFLANSGVLDAVMVESEDDILAHYGVKGMRWGIRKADDGSGRDRGTKEERRANRRETKAQKFEARAAIGQAKVAELDKARSELPPGILSLYKRYDIHSQKQAWAANVNQQLKDAERVRQGKLTSTQRRLVAGAVIVGVVLLAAGAAHMSETGQLNSLRLRGQAFIRGEVFDFARNKDFARRDLSPDEVLSQVAKGVNPNYSTPGGKMNCRRSSFAYELRRRGYDVVATTSASGAGQGETGVINALTIGGRDVGATSLSSSVRAGRGIRAQSSRDKRVNPADIFSVVESVKDKVYESPDTHSAFSRNLLSSFSRYPNGARGELVFDFTNFGHSMSWEMFNGRPYVFDTQKGQMYDISNPFEYAQLTQKWGLPRAAESTRLDNMELDHNFLARWATNRE